MTHSSPAGLKVVRKGRARARAGKSAIRVPRAGKLKRGRYKLKINGRAGRVKIRLR